MTREVARALNRLDSPEAIPRHWKPMHGDLTPWNLRQSGHNLFLLDWEDWSWGPPEADLVLYRAAEAALQGIVPARRKHQEAVDYWLGVVRSRNHERSRDRRLARSLIKALQAMRGS